MNDPVATILAGTMARIVDDFGPLPDAWEPGSKADDSLSPQAEAIDRALGEVGWSSILAKGTAGLDDGTSVGAVVAVAAVELGRGLVSLRHLDALLGGSPVVAGLVRHGRAGEVAVEILPGDGLREVRIVALEPVAYGDGSGVAALVHSEPVGDVPAGVAAERLDAWRGASVGYLSGLVSVAFEDCLAHVRAREAFGSTLDAQQIVQARLADAATAVDGVRLLVENEHSWPALSYAAAAAVDVTAACHQLTGALGYTLDYPLQRRSRRARAMRSWTEWVADVATASSAT